MCKNYLYSQTNLFYGEDFLPELSLVRSRNKDLRLPSSEVSQLRYFSNIASYNGVSNYIFENVCVPNVNVLKSPSWNFLTVSIWMMDKSFALRFIFLKLFWFLSIDFHLRLQSSLDFSNIEGRTQNASHVHRRSRSVLCSVP